jgi:Uma2 family endonuclease
MVTTLNPAVATPTLRRKTRKAKGVKSSPAFLPPARPGVPMPDPIPLIEEEDYFVYHPPHMPPTDLPTEDGEPLESNKHRAQGSLLIDITQQGYSNRKDYYAGANMFIYYSSEQADESKRTGGRSQYRGPDFFIVLDVDGSHDRLDWEVWVEKGRYPNVIVEFLSASTAETDKTTKKQLYAQTFRTQNYFYFDPYKNELSGFTLVGSTYQDLQSNEQGWLWCEELGWWLGLWTGEYQGHTHTWLRFFTANGQLIPTRAEAEYHRAETERQRAETESQRAETERQRAETERQRAETERQRAETERQRAENAEAELARLRSLLQAQGIDPKITQ